MSVSVDDLVSSLSSSHIGQEAIDLATLQAQLAQTLFGQSTFPTSSNGRHISRGRAPSFTQPSNTPTCRTPSTSFSFGDAQRQGVSRRNTDESFPEGDQMEEDERMVEDLLIPTSPMSPYPTSTNPTYNQQHAPPTFSAPKYNSRKGYSSPATSGPSAYYSQAAEPSPSLFTTTDPFYIAQLQASHNYKSPQSVFTNAGYPTQQSPFMIQQQSSNQQHRDDHGFSYSTPSGLALDTRPLFATASPAYGR